MIRSRPRRVNLFTFSGAVCRRHKIDNGLPVCPDLYAVVLIRFREHGAQVEEDVFHIRLTHRDIREDNVRIKDDLSSGYPDRVHADVAHMGASFGPCREIRCCLLREILGECLRRTVGGR